MAYSIDEQEIYDFIRNSIPKFFFAQARVEEVMGAIVKAFDRVRSEANAQFSNHLILSATAGPPDYLGLHATDRGTFRQSNESDAALRDRLRTVEDALTTPTLLDAIQSVLDAEALVGTPALVELRYDRAFFSDMLSDIGTGGEFFGTAPDMEFEPTIEFASARDITSASANNAVNLIGSNIVFAGSSTSGNDGAFEITGLNEGRVQYQNASGVAEADGATSWTHQKKDTDGNVMDGFQLGYLDRGYRMGEERAALIIILPFGSTTGTVEAVVEALRQKRGAGVFLAVERRQSP